MPRSARKKSESGIYHVMFRGINRQQVFEDEEDNRFFLQTLRKYKSECDYKILAYCLMGNHVHLLIKEGDVPLELAFRHIGARYVYWYNTKYHRVGHLFQDRYKSEAVNDISYLIRVIQYIHQNPVTAGLVRNPEVYPYSSFREYLGKPYLVDMEYVERFVSRKTIVTLTEEQIVSDCMEEDEIIKVHVTDQQAKCIISEMTGYNDVSSFQSVADSQKKECIRRLKESGVSIRQICRLTGMTYYAVQKVKVNQGTVL